MSITEQMGQDMVLRHLDSNAVYGGGACWSLNRRLCDI